MILCDDGCDSDLCCDGAVLAVTRHAAAVDRPDVAVTSLSASVSAAETAALSLSLIHI